MGDTLFVGVSDITGSIIKVDLLATGGPTYTAYTPLNEFDSSADDDCNMLACSCLNITNDGRYLFAILSLRDQQLLVCIDLKNQKELWAQKVNNDDTRAVYTPATQFVHIGKAYVVSVLAAQYPSDTILALIFNLVAKQA